MNEGKGNTVLLTIIGIATLLIAVIGATFAYFTAILSGEETEPSMTINSGTIGTVFDGGAAINATNIRPQAEAIGTKTFTVKGTSAGSASIYYDLGLVISTNTFSPGALKYTLVIDSASSINGTTAPEVTTQANIPNTGTLSLGSGIFAGPTNGEVQHVYTLSIFFPETGEDQNEDQGKILYAHISVDAESSGQSTTIQP